MLCLSIAMTSSPLLANPASRKDMQDGVDDTFNQVEVIIQALQDLEGPPKSLALKFGYPKEKPNQRNRTSVAASGKMPKPWQARHFGPFKRSTVFSNFNVCVDELSPSSFRVSVTSSEYCEDVQVKDRLTKKILARKNLDDENAFSIEVQNHGIENKYALSIAVLREGNLSYAYVPLLGDENPSQGGRP
jgi:hypothetical protein